MTIFINFSTDEMHMSCITYPAENYGGVAFGEKTLVLFHRDLSDKSEDILFVPTGALRR